jgi:hypothetical protein
LLNRGVVLHRPAAVFGSLSWHVPLRPPSDLPGAAHDSHFREAETEIMIGVRLARANSRYCGTCCVAKKMTLANAPRTDANAQQEEAA